MWIFVIALYPLIVGLLLPVIVMRKYEIFLFLIEIRPTCLSIIIIGFICLLLLPINIILSVTPGVGLSNLVWDLI